MGNYYKIEHGQGKTTPYATTILSGNKVFWDHCPRCGRTRFNYENRDLTLLLEGAGTLPDFLLCGHYPLAIVSNRVLDVWRNVGISGYESFPINVSHRKKRANHIEVQYYNITITGSAELDFAAMGVEITKICTRCGSVEYNKPNWTFGPAIIKAGTYNNLDLFTLKHFESIPICSLKVMDAIKQYRLSNFKFKDFRTMFNYTTLAENTAAVHLP